MLPMEESELSLQEKYNNIDVATFNLPVLCIYLFSFF